MAFTQRVLHLVLLALVAALLAPHVCAQYIHRGWQPGLPARREGEPAAGAHYRKDAGWSPGGLKRPSVGTMAHPKGSPALTSSEPNPPRAPRNETLTERAMRFGLTRLLRWSDERVDQTQDLLRAKSNPTFHPRIENLSGTNHSYTGFLKRLGYADPSDLSQDDLLAHMAASVTGPTTRKPWAILFSAPAGDKESQKFDAVFNRTMHALWPDPSTGYAPIIKGAGESGAEATKAVEQAKASAAATPPLPAGYEVIGGFTFRVAEPTEAPQLGPKRQSFLGNVLPKAGSLLLGAGRADGAAKESEDDVNARAETELTGQEVLTPAQWGVRQALVEAHRPAIEAEGFQFAYVDYVRQPVVEWNWAIWKVPLLVFVTPTPPGSDRPFELRYWKVSQQLPTVNEIITFLGSGAWKALPVWESAWAPGGTKFVRMRTVSAFLGTYYYPLVERVPSWALMLLSTAIAGFLPQLMHRGDQKKLKEAHEAKKRRKAVEEAVKQSMAIEAREQEEEEAALLAAPDSAGPQRTGARTVSPSKPRTQGRKRGGRR